MNSCFPKSKSQHKHYLNVDEISNEVWSELNCTENYYFNPKYLKAIQDTNPQMDWSYLVLFQNKKAVAFATIQQFNFSIQQLEQNFDSTQKKLAHYLRKIKILPKEKPLKILLCGNPFVSGEHGIFIKNNLDKSQIISDLASTITSLKNNIDIYILKDFEDQSLKITNTLFEHHFHTFQAEPNMELQIPNNWNNLDDYLTILKTKFRIKTKRALKKSESLEVRNITLENLDAHLEEMKILYKSVSRKAEFNLGDFNLDAYKNLKESLNEDYIIKGYWLQNKLVGFLSGLINKNSLDAHFVGIDYSLNKTYAIYERMLYDYLQLAINNKLEVLNYGRTASEIKSSVGAKHKDLTVYIRHKKTITNRILKLFLSRIQPTEFNQKKPFKNISIENG